ncbi:MAG: hypothetical protein BGP24_04925 [Lysobacterales bacterium 69-70]|nr:hypothetical protein [Xanthomonadaceae bacterium]ODU32395.1 MAG: hypothetical protein ABS97_16200 [Xanthomonadaceae bacterium SCN 69-320]ODV15556.1 MAG: hypothetical protein ABT27_22680 [Xanthomonadaceae bacterium SCN 69-25]OJY95499.1 MAG: hypothetical protein BGP24_04925 [Xanthomonadales bacterium 69-70]
MNASRGFLARAALLAVTAAAAMLTAAQAARTGGNGRDDLLQGDAYGHRVSAAPDVCAYQAIDISASGQALAPIAASGTVTALDDGAAELDLSQPFAFYGESWQRIAVSTNGYLAFTADPGQEDGGDFNNDPYVPSLPDNARAAAARVLAYHDELDGEGAGATLRSAYFASCPRPSGLGDEACSVVQWKNWSRSGSSGALDVALILYHSSAAIALQYAALDASAGSSACIGIQADGAVDGLNWSCNGARPLVAASAICLFDPAHLPPDFSDRLFANGFEP